SSFNDDILFRPAAGQTPAACSISDLCVSVIDSKYNGEFLFDSGFRSLAQAILDYGARAQDYFDYKCDLKAKPDFPVTLDNPAAWNNINQVTSSVSSPAFVPVGTSLVLTDRVHLNVWFQGDAGLDPASYTVRVAGAAQTTKLEHRGNGYFTFDFAVDGSNINKSYRFQVFSGTNATVAVSDPLVTSVGSYCSLLESRINAGNTVSSNDSALLALCESLNVMYYYRNAYLH
ncbi:MAG: hypothetical protein II776_07630, partial [Clostridia bacterium]|nr:hypothetical protein [Clostridia bacterium]